MRLTFWSWQGTFSGASEEGEYWRAAKDAYQKSLDIYKDMKSKGTLSGPDANKPDDLAKEIAKCDAALKVSNKTKPQ